MKVASKRIDSLDFLRGLAALAVCWFHYTNCLPSLVLPSWIRLSGRPGWHGVEIFFVLSGFVIPYSLHRAQYQLRGFGQFLAKRLVRLHPPYVASLILILALNDLGQRFLGTPTKADSHSLGDILLHLIYGNGILGLPWINSVYWTLAIELQFYLLIGLIFPLVSKAHSWKPEIVLVGLGVLALVLPQDYLVFHYLAPFLLGMTVYRFHVGLLGRCRYVITILVLAAGCWWTLAATSMLASVATALFIAHVRFGACWPFPAMGKISYSLYLLHFPIGILLAQLLAGLTTSPGGSIAVLLLCVASALAAATAFYFAIEKPGQKWSSAIGYQPIIRDEAVHLSPASTNRTILDM
jgi:peptidoglycan/LPS O-acetylase OafA/YrhL